MKAAAFDYARASSAEEACRLLAGAQGDGKVIAGGQTLVPLLVMRLARPTLVVDINPAADLRGIAESDGVVVIRAATRQADALEDETLRRRLPLFFKGLGHVGHPQTRNRGTIGGSLANADPAAEIGLCTVTLDGEITARSLAGERRIPAAGFFQSAMATALNPDECLTQLCLTPWRDAGRIGTGFQEMSIRHSDFALVAAAAQVALDDDGLCRRLVVGIGGAGPVPVRVDGALGRLVGTRLSDADIAAATPGIAERIDPLSDMHASADYRRRVAVGLAARALSEARDEARAGRG